MYHVPYVLSHATLPLIRRCHSNKNEYTTFFENPKKSLRPIDGLAGLQQTYSFMRGFDLEVFLHLRISVLQQAYSRMHCPSHTQGVVQGRPAFTHLHLLLQLFLQP